jgi:hypothetical protein
VTQAAGTQHRHSRSLKLAVVLPVLLLSTGCATASVAWRAGPGGIPAENGIRAQLSSNRADEAWRALANKKVAPSDALLRHMYRSVVSLHAGEYEAGTHATERAWTIAEDRFTRQLSRGALSMVTAEAVLPYQPGPTERMLIPYYGSLNWLARNERFEAAVEARRLASMLESNLSDEMPRGMQGILRYVSGAVFEAAGERQDALVAYRNAAAMLGMLPGDTTLAGSDSGDVVVLIEDGFVGRPEPRALGVYLSNDELVALSASGGDEAGRLAIAQVVEQRSWSRRNGYNSELEVGWLTYELNWASFAPSDRPARGSSVRVGGCEETCLAPTVSADVTEAVGVDFNREQGARLARAIARTSVRYAASRAAERAFERAGEERDKRKDEGKKGGGWGQILLGIGLLAGSLTSSAIDQPDLRAWQVLPDRITVARLRLPVGEHPIEVVRDGVSVTLGTVSVAPGSVVVLNHRWWP